MVIHLLASSKYSDLQLGGGACRLLEKGETRGERPAEKNVEVIGWHAPDDGAYLLPEIARRAVEGVLARRG